MELILFRSIHIRHEGYLIIEYFNCFLADRIDKN